MAKLSKRVKAAQEKISRGEAKPIDEALALVKELASAKFVETVDVSVNLGVDPKKSDQNVRGATVLPNGTGKSVRVAVFAQGENAEKAKAAGADIVGFDRDLPSGQFLTRRECFLPEPDPPSPNPTGSTGGVRYKNHRDSGMPYW